MYNVFESGHYITGQGHAHECCRPHIAVFNTKMFGTFNIQIPNFRIQDHEPSMINGGKRYWFVLMQHMESKTERMGWAIRDVKSRQRQNTIEVLTKKLLPDSWKEGVLRVMLPKRWAENEIDNWAKNKYWFQTFSFTPKPKADSAGLWKTINLINWSGLDVIDYGCHYGYMSFRASAEGASVIGVEKNLVSIKQARCIRDHIIQQDVAFRTAIILKPNMCDVILHLSVLHQIDETYKSLPSLIKILKNSARKHVFLELIMPPMFPQGKRMSESKIDKIVGGTVLLRYKHSVRGNRKVYHIRTG